MADENKRLQNALHTSKENLHQLIMSNYDMFFIVDKKNTFVTAIGRRLNDIGLKSLDIIGKNYG